MTPKNRPGRPSKGRADTIDDVLLTAAQDLFCTHGVSGTSMDDIARAAGTTKQTIYRRYASKMALIDAVVKRDLELMGANNAEDFGPPLMRLKAQARRFFDFVADESLAKFTRFLRAEAAYCTEFRGRMQSWYIIVVGMMDAAIITAQNANVIKQGEVRHASHLLGDLLGGPGHAMTNEINDPFLGMTPDAYFEQRWNIFLRIWGVDATTNVIAHETASNDTDTHPLRMSD